MIIEFFGLIIYSIIMAFGFIKRDFLICIFSTMLVASLLSRTEKNLDGSWGYLFILQTFLLIFYCFLALINKTKKK